MNNKEVCIIGAGIAGLVTAKVLREDGFSVTIYDKAPGVGGVWEASRTYPGLRANNSRITYSFSDFPYPAGTDDFPTAEQVRGYLNAYADHFGLRPYIQLETEVELVRQSTAQGGFDVTFRTRNQPTAHRHFDFVAVCNGVFNEPAMPHFDGAESFTGQIVHSSRIRSSEMLAGKRVVVVGAAKSGVDCANFASQCAQSTTMLFRRAHWIFPRYLPNGRRGEDFFFNRMVAAMSGYHKRSRLMKWFEGPLKPVTKLFWMVETKMAIKEAKMPPHMVPDIPLPAGLSFAGAGTEFYDALNEGKVSSRRATIRRFAGGDTIELDNGERIAADVVILATGWRQSVPFLSKELQAMVRPGRNFRLYRYILPPDLPNLGFVGYASSLACQLSSEVAAHWLSENFLGRLRLPDATAMHREIDRVAQWNASMFPGRPEGYFIGGSLLPYADEIMEDLGLRKRRLPSLFREYFGCLSAERYRDISAERRAKAVSADRTFSTNAKSAAAMR